MRIDVEKGASLSQALAKHPKAFNRLYVAMVQGRRDRRCARQRAAAPRRHDREAGRAAPQGEVGDDLPGRRRRCSCCHRHRDAAVRHPDVRGPLRGARWQAAGADADAHQHLEGHPPVLVARSSAPRSRPSCSFRRWINSEERPQAVGRDQAEGAGVRAARPQDGAGPLLPHAVGARALGCADPRVARHRRRDLGQPRGRRGGARHPERGQER